LSHLDPIFFQCNINTDYSDKANNVNSCI